MATPAEKLADSLQELKKLQDKGIVAIKSEMLSRTHRERLLKNNFIEEVYKGWYMAVPPDATKGDSTTWYSHYWEFCSQYLEERLGKDWIISPEHSLLVHAGNTSVPGQLIVRSPKANNSITNLPSQTSIFFLRSELPPEPERSQQDGLRTYTLPAALTRCSANTYAQNELDVRTALSLVNDSSEILSILLEGGHSVLGGRIVGAFRNMGKDKLANAIMDTMAKAGYDIRESDPFHGELPISLSARPRSPYENRIKLMWSTMRGAVLENFPKAPGVPEDILSYMKTVEDIYVTDAYHSLSIERYRVTPELIARIKSGAWDMDNKKDQQHRDAMAAKGYFDAFNAVKESVRSVLNGGNPGEIANEHHGTWYRELFGPSIAAGILKPSDLAGYRNGQVYIGNSMHTPLNREAVRVAMPVLFDLLANETEAAVRAVLGHFIFVFIHPYMDGNGRMGRFLMNVMLASGGYPWTVIPVEQRAEYMQALEKASVGQDIEPFTRFLGTLVAAAIEGRPVAKV